MPDNDSTDRFQANTPDEFWEACSKSGECLIAPRKRVIYQGARRNVARIALEIHTGASLGPRERVRRKCSNRRCVNPEHLEAYDPRVEENQRMLDERFGDEA